MTGTALITGASSGIGLELAKLHAQAGGDLVLVARREDALEALASELTYSHGVSVQVVAVDLTQPDAAARVHDAAPHIDILINNAGFGALRSFADQSLETQLAMISLNVRALTDLTHRYLASMCAQGGGRILNVASTAGFLPSPGMATYFATKAYVVSFSQALAQELRGSGITVTALCPGPVRTEFFDRAGMADLAVTRQARDAKLTAAVGYKAMQAGRPLVFDDWRLGFLLGWVVPILPRRLVLWALQRSMQTR
ncbi:MAG: SDR family oxidoreductase [Pseudomonadota bacterium]